MSIAKNIFHRILERSSSYAVLFFALLLLTGACPVKQFIKSTHGTSVNTQYGSKNNHTVSLKKGNERVSCCFINQQSALKKISNQLSTPSFQFIFSDYNAEKGFDLYYFLNGQHVKVFSYTPAPSTTSLPRFLQTRRILV
ncbi:MAG: hypothetical protein ABIN48_12020 [Ginsengibacter sp.]